MIRQFILSLVILASAVSCTRKQAAIENSVTYAFKSNLKGFDPIEASDLYVAEVVMNIFEPLLQYNYLKRPLVLEPLLAASLPTVSADGLTYTIKIKPGIRFQDSDVFPEGKGREVTAQDFIYSWKRVADPSSKSESFWIFDGKVKGLNEWRDKLAKGQAKFDDTIEGLQAPDAQTIVIKLTRPFYQMNYILAYPATAVVPREAVEKHGKEFLNHPVGTGPFKFESWIRGSKLVLTKNPTWHGQTYPTEGTAEDKEKGLLADAGKPLPFVDKVVFLEITEDQPRWLNFMKGEIDFTGIPKDNFDAAIENGELKADMKAKGILLEKRASSEVVYISFNMEDPILGKNANLRKALSLAYDSDTFIQKFYNGRGIKAHGPIGPDSDGYDPNFKNPYKEFNVSKAKEFLAKAGYPDGKGLPTLEYSDSGSTTGRQMAEYLQHQWGQIGVKINIASFSWPQFTERLREKKAQLWGIAWTADYPDAENFLQLLYGKNVSPGPNAANYVNKEFDELYNKASLMPPGPERTRIYQQMRDKVVEDMPWIPNAHRLAYTTQHGWISNLKSNETILGTFKYLRVDTAKKAALKAKL